MGKQITQIKNSDVNNGTEFYRLEKDIQEILKWKNEVEKEILEKNVETYIKTETSEDEDDTEDLEKEIEPDLASEDELDIEIDVDNEIVQDTVPTKTISTKNEELQLEWYKFSARFVTEEFKLKYVHPDAEATNKKKVFDWYEKCCDMGLVPEEFKLAVEENEPEEENSQSNKKSFHKQRKEEWKKRNASKNVFKISEDKENKKNKKEHVFSKIPLL